MTLPMNRIDLPIQKAQNFSYDSQCDLTERLPEFRLKAKILIAEEESIFAVSLRSVLTRLGYNVCELAATGEDAVERIRHENLDLVILGVKFNGGINGIEAAMQIRSGSEIPIILISGYEERKLIEQIKSVSSSTYLIKPITPKDIESAIIHALQNE